MRGRVRHWVGLALLWLAWLWPSPCRAQSSVDYSAGIESYHQLTLANGLRAVIAVDSRLPQVAVHIAYGVGEALDPPEQRGLARLIGELLPQAPTLHLSASERARLFEAAGFKYEPPSVQVGPDTTTIELDVPSGALELALWVEADRMGFGADGLSQQAVSGAVTSATKALAGSAFDARAALFSWTFGAQHPYARLSSAPSLSSATAAVVAARLRRYYNPATAVIVLVGDLKAAAAQQALERTFGSLAASPLTTEAVSRVASAPKSVRVAAPIPARHAEMSWATPAYLLPDDLELDLVADLLVRGLERRGVCDKVEAYQRSRFLDSVFGVSCTNPKGGSADAWQAAVRAELAVLADGKAAASDVEGIALGWQRVTSERIDSLPGRAVMISALARRGQEPRQLVERLKAYSAISAQSLGAVVRRTLLKAPDATLEVLPDASAPKQGRVLSAAPAPSYRPPIESAPPAQTVNARLWSRPPPAGPERRYVSPLNVTETLPSGDRLLFVQREGLPLASALLLIPWRAASTHLPATEVLSGLLMQYPDGGKTLETALRDLGIKIEALTRPDLLEIRIAAPSARLLSGLQAVARVLRAARFSEQSLAEVKRQKSTSWARKTRDLRWTALGLSARQGRYRNFSRGERESALASMKLEHIERLWRATRKLPLDFDIVGPFDADTARALARALTEDPSSRRVAGPRRGKVAFQLGAYLVTDDSAELVEGCVLWPLPKWGTQAHVPAHLLPWLFRADVPDGLSARFRENGTQEPRWDSNTMLTQDGDFLRYSFQSPVAHVGPILKSLQAHLAHMAEREVAADQLARALHAEHQFQVRQLLSTRGSLFSLYRASNHDLEARDALAIPALLGRADPAALHGLIETLDIKRSIIALRGPTDELTAALAQVGLTPSYVSKEDGQASDSQTEGTP
jgi:predicted Zn-dependent peptidase